MLARACLRLLMGLFLFHRVTLVTVLPSSFPIFDSSLLAGFSCRYKSRLKGTRESFSLDLQGRETNLWKYDETIRSALFNVCSGPYFVTSSSSIWLSSSSFIFTDTRSSDVVLHCYSKYTKNYDNLQP